MGVPFTRFLVVAPLAIAFSSLGGKAEAIDIVPTYSGFTADQQATINAAIAFFNSTYTDNVTVNINFQVDQSVLGASSAVTNDMAYHTVYTSLVSKATSALQLQAVGTLPNQTNDPVQGLGLVTLTTANQKALGLYGGSASASDGTVWFGTNSCFTNSQGPQSGKYSLQAVAEHEIDEIMGGGGWGCDIAFSTYTGMTDLYRYGSAGVRSYTSSSSATAYLSADGGNTVINYFSQDGVGDYGDWKNGGTNHVQDEYGTPGVNVAYGVVETDEMQMIGWHTTAAPEPVSSVLLGASVFGLAARRRMKNKAAK